MAKPTSAPPAGWEWVLNDTEDPPVWTLSRVDPRGPELKPSEVGHYAGWAPGMPDAPPKPGMRYQSGGYREGYGSQGWVEVPASQTEAEWIAWQKERPAISNGEGGILTMKPYVFTPSATLPATPKVEPAYAGNVPLPPQDAAAAAVGLPAKTAAVLPVQNALKTGRRSRWSWRR